MSEAALEVVRVLRLLPDTVAEGPGRRAALWVAGCSIRCPGCFNPHSWDPAGGTAWSVGALADHIGATAGIEGVTFLGGEPFDQAAPLARLAGAVRDRVGLSVMTFTGYTIEALRAGGDPGHGALLAATDLLVDGPYRADRPEPRRPERGRPWVGSTNQRFHFLTPRYRHLEGEGLAALPNRVELRIGLGGVVEVNGFAPVDVLESLLETPVPTGRRIPRRPPGGLQTLPEPPVPPGPRRRRPVPG